VSKGFRNWKTALEDGRGLVQHAASIGHIAAMAKWSEFEVRRNSCKTIEHQLSGEQLLRNRYYVKSIAEVVQFLAVNELSFRGDNEGIGLHDDDHDSNCGGLFLNLFQYTLLKDAKLRDISACIPKNAKYTSPEIQNEIISAMACAVQRKIVQACQQSDIGKFCLKCDETRDISNVENMSLVLRFVKDGLPREHLLSLVELGDVDAKAIAHSIFDELRNHNISLSSILSQCYDGANVMCGAKGGVRKFVEDEVGRPVPYIHCFNHQLHLAVVHAMQKQPQARNFFAICEHLYTFFRRQLPSTVYEGTTVKRLLEQRWTGHLESANIVLLNRNSIIEALTLITESPKASAEMSVEAAGLKAKVSQPHFAAVGEIAVQILSILKPANIMLQGKSCTMTDAMTVINAAIESMQELRCDYAFEQIMIKSEMSVSELGNSSSVSSASDTATIAADGNTNSFYGDAGTRPKRIKTQNTMLQSFVVLSTLGQDSSAVSRVRPSTQVGLKQLMFALLDDVIGEMKARFNEQNVSLVNAVAALVPKSSSFLHLTALHPLVELLELDSSQLEGELTVLKRVITNKVAQESNLEDVFKVVLQFKDAFPMAHILYVGGVTIGVSTASCENSFSTLARVLRPHRKSMTHARKADLVLLAYEKRLCRDIDMDEVLDIFQLHSRRLQL